MKRVKQFILWLIVVISVKVEDMNPGYIILIGLFSCIIGVMCGIFYHNMIVNAIMCGIGGMIMGNGVAKSLK